MRSAERLRHISPIQARLASWLHQDTLGWGPESVVEFAASHPGKLDVIVWALLPSLEDVEGSSATVLARFQEAVDWLAWLLYGQEPQAAKEHLKRVAGASGGVCGAIWGLDDVAYRCRTCENDPTCAVCMQCFLEGDHGAHDYSMIRTGGGCCDCGDVSAWKEGGFCARHRRPSDGAAPVSLPEAFVGRARPVLGATMRRWCDCLSGAREAADMRRARHWDRQGREEQEAGCLTQALVNMLLGLCHCGESATRFVAECVAAPGLGLLAELMLAERAASKDAVTSAHALLYKLLGDPAFKLAFALVFISNYNSFLGEFANDEDDSLLSNPAEYQVLLFEHSVLDSFSVQIFSVPALTAHLVETAGLLSMLLGMLKRVLRLAAGKDGRFDVRTREVRKKHYWRITEDLRYVLSHPEVARWTAREQPALLQTFLQLLAFLQGMAVQVRQVHVHVEVESDDWSHSYTLEKRLAGVHTLLVQGAADQASLLEGGGCDAGHSQATASAFALQAADKVHGWRLHRVAGVAVAGPLLYLLSKCLQIVALWLAVDAARATRQPQGQAAAPVATRRLLSGRAARELRLGRVTIRGVPMERPPQEENGRRPAAAVAAAAAAGAAAAEVAEDVQMEDATAPEAEAEQGARAPAHHNASAAQQARMRETLSESNRLHGNEGEESGEVVDVNGASTIGVADIQDDMWWMGSDTPLVQPDAAAAFSIQDPPIAPDPSQLEVSFHIPLHRMLALLLHSALGPAVAAGDKVAVPGESFLLDILPAKFRSPGFVMALMEHPLRLQVACSQVQAGMWRRNGHPMVALADRYHSVFWCENTLELDMFLLQCCAVLSFPEALVGRVCERFGLAEYFTLSATPANEYEPDVAHDLLCFLVRLVSERSLCGLSTEQTVRRELVQRLAAGDATHSTLLESLPQQLADSPLVTPCLEQVADYSMPRGLEQGKYTLKKECWRELDLYHVRWSPRELQRTQDRFQEVLGIPASTSQLPTWQDPTPPLSSLWQIATTSGVYKMVVSVLFHAQAVDAQGVSTSRAPDHVVLAALHLLALGLSACKAAVGKQLIRAQEVPLVSRAAEYVTVQEVRGRHGSCSLLSLLADLQRKWADRSFANGQLSRIANDGGGRLEEGERGELAQLAARLLKELTVLSKACRREAEELAPDIVGVCTDSPTVTGMAASSPPAGSVEGDRRKMLAKMRQAEAMARMRSAQDRFAASIAQGSRGGNEHSKREEGSENDDGSDMSAGPLQARPPAVGAGEVLVSMGDGQDAEEAEERSEGGQVRDTHSASLVCALCRESSFWAAESPLCYVALAQRSKLVAASVLRSSSWDLPPLAPASHALPGLEAQDSISLVQATQEARDETDLMSAEELNLLVQQSRPGTEDQGPQLPTQAVQLMQESMESTLADNDERADEERSAAAPSNSDSQSGPAAVVVPMRDVLAEYVAASHNLREERARSAAAAERRGGVSFSGGLVDIMDHLPGRGAAAGVADMDLDGGIELEAGSRRRRGRRRVGAHHGLDVSAKLHVATCGHALHQSCLDRYFSSLLQRYLSREYYEGASVVNPVEGEYLCPMCRRLANATLPLVPIGCSEGTRQYQSRAHVSQAQEKLMVPQCPAEPSTDSVTIDIQQDLAAVRSWEGACCSDSCLSSPGLPAGNNLKDAMEAFTMRLAHLARPNDDSWTSLMEGRDNQGLLLWEALAYTVSAAELATRSQLGTSMEFDPRHALEKVLKRLGKVTEEEGSSILPALARLASRQKNHSIQALRLRARGMQLLVGSIVHGSLGDNQQSGGDAGQAYLKHNQNSFDVQFWNSGALAVLLGDSFTTFAHFCFCLPTSAINAKPVLRLLYLANAIKALAHLVCQVPSAVCKLPASIRPLAAFLHSSLASYLAPLPPFSSPVLQSFSTSPMETLARFTLSFLRSSALLWHLLFEALPALTMSAEQAHRQLGMYWVRHGNVADDCLSKQVSQEEVEVLLWQAQLGLPNLGRLLEDEYAQSIARRWACHMQGDLEFKGAEVAASIVQPSLATPFRLLSLPHLFHDLFQRYVKDKCLTCKTVPEHPALCLVCGRLCCAMLVRSQRPCCSRDGRGECQQHAQSCGGGTCVFLLIRSTSVVLLRGQRSSVWPSPYLDVHGEEDENLRRGKPLYLNLERYEALTAMVASHGLDHNSLVLASTTRIRNPI
eukprot:SM000143S00761  [mRNA]  locus=s143:215929:225527:- [translate_table: standard]